MKATGLLQRNRCCSQHSDADDGVVAAAAANRGNPRGRGRSMRRRGCRGSPSARAGTPRLELLTQRIRSPDAASPTQRTAAKCLSNGVGDDECDEWKLFMLAPRMLLFHAPGQPCVPVEELRCREHAFLAGHWPELLRQGAAAATPASREAGRPSEDNGVEPEDVDLCRPPPSLELRLWPALVSLLRRLPLAPTSLETLAALRG